MLLCELKSYIDFASDDQDIGIVVRSIDTGDEITAAFDLVADISEYGELMLSIVI